MNRLNPAYANSTLNEKNKDQLSENHMINDMNE